MIGTAAARTPARSVAAARAAVLAAGLAAAMGLRLGAGAGWTSQPAGCLFAACLVGLALLSGWRPGPLRPGSVTAGLALGAGAAALLCALPLAHRLVTGASAPPLPALAALAPWSAATVAVAVAEEVLLRGALHDAVRAALSSDAAAVAIGAVAFALIHLPLYGVGALPLDLGVGVLLGCLRVASGGVAAPATAHALADVAVWWVW